MFFKMSGEIYISIPLYHVDISVESLVLESTVKLTTTYCTVKEHLAMATMVLPLCYDPRCAALGVEKVYVLGLAPQKGNSSSFRAGRAVDTHINWQQ